MAVASRDSGRCCVWPGVTRGWVKGVFKENWFVGQEVNRKPGESEGLGLGPPQPCYLQLHIVEVFSDLEQIQRACFHPLPSRGLCPEGSGS